MERRSFLAAFPTFAALVGLRPRLVVLEPASAPVAGLRGLVDDGTFASAVHGCGREYAAFAEELARVYPPGRIFEVFERDSVFGAGDDD